MKTIGISLEEKTIQDLQSAMENGELTSKEIVLGYLERIAAYDKSGPNINSILEVNPDAIHIAEALDHERKMTGPRSGLHGIPVIVKDNIDTGDKMRTSAGSLALQNHIAKEDSIVAKKLREAGAVILGKANMTEWANFMTYNMPNGYSSRGGQVLNPYGPGTFDVGGSSSGSGASVAANLTAVAIGTETSGSILSPSSSNSVVGIKPTIGLVSRTGIIPIAHSQDTAGPIARTVEDAAILLGAIAGYDEKDPITFLSKEIASTDYAKALDANALRGAKIGIARQYYKWLDENQLSIMNQAIEDLKSQGATIIDPIDIPSFEIEKNINVLVYEFKSDLNSYLATVGPHVPVHSLADVIAYNEQHAEEALKFEQKLLLESDATSGTLTDAEYLNSRINDLIQSQQEGIDAVFHSHELDAMLLPANYGADIAARAGYPSITVPGGYTSEGKPLGITFTGMAFTETKLIGLAYAYEQATKRRVPPKL